MGRFEGKVGYPADRLVPVIKLNTRSLFRLDSVNKSPIEVEVSHTGRVGHYERGREGGRDVDGLAGGGWQELISRDTDTRLLLTQLVAEELCGALTGPVTPQA